MRIASLIVAVLASDFDVPVAAQDVQEEKQPKKPARPPEVIVTASRLDEKPEDVGSSATVIGAEDLKRAQKRRVFEALREVPAVDVAQTGSLGGTTSVYLRGANPEHTLVLVDGVEVNDAAAGGRDFDFAHLTTDNVERIEIIRGPQSVLYGSDALGGVIHVITRHGGGPTRLGMSLEGGSFATYRGALTASGGTDKVNYSLGASHVQSAGFSSATDRDGRNSERDGYRSSTFSTLIGFTPTDGFEMDLMVRHTDARSELDGSGGAAPDDPNYTAEYDQWTVKAEPRLTLLDGAWEQKLGLKLTEVERNIENLPDDLHPTSFTFSSFDSRVADLDWQHDLRLHESNTFTVGAEFEEDTARTSTVRNGPSTSVFRTKTAWSRGMYLQDRVHLWDRFTATAGVRADAHEEFGTHVTWRTTAAYRVEPTATKLRATAGTGFKAPSLFQLFSSFGDPALEPEKSLGWDVGVDQDLCDGRVRLSATYFRNEFENLILFDGGLSRYANVGRADSEGFETAASFRPAESLELTLSYTYTDTEDKSTNEELFRRASHKGGIRATVLPAEGIAVSGGVVYVGRRDDQDFATFPATRVVLHEYWLADVAVSYRVGADVELFGRVENAFDQEYEQALGFGVADVGATVGASISF